MKAFSFGVFWGNRAGSGLLWLITLTLIISSTLLIQQSGRLIDLLAMQRKAFQELKRGDHPTAQNGSSLSGTTSPAESADK